MKVVLYTPWNNRWKDSTLSAFERAAHICKWNVNPEGSDIALNMWCDQTTVELSKHYTGKLFTYIRNYEVYGPYPNSVQWEKIKGVFFCAKHIQQIANIKFEGLKNVPQYVIPNWLEVEDWPFKNDSKNSQIAMVCRIHPAKNLPLALQIIKNLPEEFQLHVVGDIQDESLLWYCEHFVKDNKMDDRVFFYKKIPLEQVKLFLADKTYILSTSYREGCPMNVLEAMATGLKPVIHNWMGAKDIFKTKWVFDTVEEAIQLFKENSEEPKEYRQFVIDNHNPSLADKLVEIVTNGLVV